MKVIFVFLLYLTKIYAINVHSQQIYEKVITPTLLSGIQIISTSETSSRVSCGVKCSVTRFCIGFAISSSCLLLDSVSLGDKPFVYTDGTTVFLRQKVSLSVLAFRVTSGVGGDPYPFYSNPNFSPLSEVKAAVDLSNPLNTTYKSEILERWSSFGIIQVEVAFVSASSVIKRVVFDGSTATDKYNWYKVANILSSPWSDLTARSYTVNFDIRGPLTDNMQRRFYMAASHGTCTYDMGWFAVVSLPDPCTWANSRGPFPALIYSLESRAITWEAETGSVGLAKDVMVFVKIGM